MARALHVCTQCLKFENLSLSVYILNGENRGIIGIGNMKKMKASVGSGLGMRLLQWTVHCMDDDRVTLKGCFETVLARSRFGLFILSNFLLVVQSDDVTSAMPLIF